MSIVSALTRLPGISLPLWLRYKVTEIRYKSHAHSKIYTWHWHEKNFNRIALVNLLVAHTRGWETDYLEIGCCATRSPNVADAVVSAGHALAYLEEHLSDGRPAALSEIIAAVRRQSK